MLRLITKTKRMLFIKQSHEALHESEIQMGDE